MENNTFGVTDEIKCENISNISKKDYETCTIVFDENENATVTIVGNGSYDGLSCSGIKDSVVCE